MIKYKNNNLNLCLKIQDGNDSKADRSKELISVKIKKIGKSKIMKEINGNCDQTKKITSMIHGWFIIILWVSSVEEKTENIQSTQ